MRKKVSRQELKMLNSKIPDFKTLLLENDTANCREPYRKMFISIFDHWLNNENADEVIFIDNDLEELQSRRDKFKSFIEELYKITDIYLLKYKRNNKIYVYRPSTVDDVLKQCDFDHLNSRRGNYYSFLLPEFSTIYTEEWDWTNMIWFQEETDIQKILSVVEKTGLHIIKD